MKKNKIFGATQSFSRYEFKFILSKNKADSIENEIKQQIMSQQKQETNILKL